MQKRLQSNNGTIATDPMQPPANTDPKPTVDPIYMSGLSSKESEDTNALCAENGWKSIAKPADRPRVYNLVLWNGEKDTLEILLYEIFQYLDYLILVEGEITFSGKDKPIFYRPEDFPLFKDKIIHVVLTKEIIQTNCPDNDSWKKEHFHRNKGIELGLTVPGKMARPGDMVLIGDTDEVPRRRTMEKIKKCAVPMDLFVIESTFYYFSFEFRHQQEFWPAPTVFRFPGLVRDVKTWDYMRMSGDRNKFIVSNMSYHCSWCFKTIAEFQQKAQSYAHTEHNTEKIRDPKWIADHVRSGVDIFERQVDKFFVMENNMDIPELLKVQSDRFSYMTNRRNAEAGFGKP
jgi:beta-1,4-mannosyl-glycoprotein beta-1,4-N-acetylglucosaminyltransferase